MTVDVVVVAKSNLFFRTTFDISAEVPAAYVAAYPVKK
jgi:hypothetical protein